MWVLTRASTIRGAERLGDVVHRSQGQPVLLILDVGQTGNQDHRDALGDDLLLQLLEKGEAVHAGHDYVQQDEGKGLRAGAAEPVLRRLRDGDVVAALQNGLQLGGLQGAVVDNQYFFHMLFHSPRQVVQGAASGRSPFFWQGQYTPFAGRVQYFSRENFHEKFLPRRRAVRAKRGGGRFFMEIFRKTGKNRMLL